MKTIPCKECLKYAICVALVTEASQIAPLYRRCDLVDRYVPSPDMDISLFEEKVNEIRNIFGLPNAKLHQGIRSP